MSARVPFSTINLRPIGNSTSQNMLSAYYSMWRFHKIKTDTNHSKQLYTNMQLITLSFLLIAVAQASAAATSTYSASASNGVVSSDDNYHYNKFETGTGICTGGTTYCGSFTGNGCPYPLCDTSYERTADIFTCQAGSGQSDKVACADLVEYQCKDLLQRVHQQRLPTSIL
eukprot:scaffold1933_cov145-Skeletonema_dohrnii-CCMP3373.AAC.13